MPGGGGSKGSRRKSGAVPATVKADQLVSEVRNLPWSVVRFLGRVQPRGVGPAADEAAHPSVTTGSSTREDENARFANRRHQPDRHHRVAHAGGTVANSGEC